MPNLSFTAFSTGTMALVVQEDSWGDDLVISGDFTVVDAVNDVLQLAFAGAVRTTRSIPVCYSAG